MKARGVGRDWEEAGVVRVEWAGGQCARGGGTSKQGPDLLGICRP